MAGEKVLFVDGDAASRKYVAASLRRLNYEVITAESGKEALAAARSRAPMVVLVDPDLPDMTGEELAAALRGQPNTAAMPLLALSHDPDPAREESCLRAGFSDFLLKSPQALLELEPRLARLLARSAPKEREGGWLVAFLSAKGGTGTSTLCANIAMQMADHRPHSRVIVADLVLPIGSIAGIVGREGATNIVGLSLAPEAQTTPEALHGSLPRLDGWQFHLLAGSPDPERGNALDVGRIGEIVHTLQRGYDLVVLDLGRSLSRISLPLIEWADVVVMIVGNDPATVDLSRVIWEFLQSKGIRAQSMFVILNRAVGLEGLTKDQAEKALGLPVSAAFPHQPENYSLANIHHQPYCARFPADTTAIILKETAIHIMDLAQRLRGR